MVRVLILPNTRERCHVARNKQKKEEIMETLKVKIIGESPLLMHNKTGIDVFNPLVKQFKTLSKTKNKTEADLLELRRMEWIMGLYTKNNKIILPGEIIEATMKEAAKKFKLGKEVTKAVQCLDDAEVDYPEKKLSLAKLYENPDYVFVASAVVDRKRIVRVRPILPTWSIIVNIMYDKTRLDRGRVVDILREAGSYVGFCDWRPRFGRFRVEELN